MRSSRGIYYELTGPQQAPTLIFSNSLGTDLSMWQKQVDYFSPDYQILLYDTRGHGQSPTTSPPPEKNKEKEFSYGSTTQNSPSLAHSWSLQDLGEDVIGLLDDCKIQKVHYCGISLGGFTGMWLAANYPERFLSMTLANTSPRISTAQAWQDRIDLVRQKGLAPVSEASPSRWFTAEYLKTHQDAAQEISRKMLRNSAEGYIACCRILKDTDLGTLLQKIKIPTLIIAGKYDSVTTEQEAKSLQTNIESSKLETLMTSHLSSYEQPENFNKVLHQWLTNLKNN